MTATDSLTLTNDLATILSGIGMAERTHADHAGVWDFRVSGVPRGYFSARGYQEGRRPHYYLPDHDFAFQMEGNDPVAFAQRFAATMRGWAESHRTGPWAEYSRVILGS